MGFASGTGHFFLADPADNERIDPESTFSSNHAEIFRSQSATSAQQWILSCRFREDSHATGIECYVLSPDAVFCPCEVLVPGLITAAVHDSGIVDDDSSIRWSRSSAALGHPSAWLNLAKSRIGVVGVGRLGSVIAQHLAATGVRKLVLVDPDVVQLHNLGESIVYRTNDIGENKAMALARHLENDAPRSSIHAVPLSVSAREGLEHLKSCDVIFACVDDDAARLTVAGIGMLFHIPIIDAGSSVENSGDTLGCTVRSQFPMDGCLICRAGGFRDEHGALVRLGSVTTENEFRENRVWYNERSGSLMSLNLIAAGYSLRCLEDMFKGTLVKTSGFYLAWNGGEYEAGTIKDTGRSANGGTGCLCELSGLGDEGVASFREWIAVASANI
ncbi:MAG: ThiF family adenylyltransferase [Bacteroidota bacterium]|jgi:hypothetical protein